MDLLLTSEALQSEKQDWIRNKSFTDRPAIRQTGMSALQTGARELFQYLFPFDAEFQKYRGLQIRHADRSAVTARATALPVQILGIERNDSAEHGRNQP